MSEPPDKILVSAVECLAAVGVSAEERTLKHRLSVDVEVTADLRPPAASDSLEDAIDYSRIVELVAALAAEREYRLIETLAERIAERVLADCGGTEVRVRVRRQPPPLAAPVGYVGVEVVRGSGGHS